MTGILFDLDGVIYQSGTPIPGAEKTLKWVQNNNIPHLYVTNTTSKPRADIIKVLKNFGITTNAQHILTPPVAASNWLNSRLANPRVALYVGDATQTDFSTLTISPEGEKEVDAVVIGHLGDQWNFQRLNAAFRQLNTKPETYLIALGLTRYWETPAGLELDVGPFVKALEYAASKEAIVCGKPSPSFFHAAAKQLTLKPKDLIMIGDDIQGDIGGAQQAGIKGLQVRTGKFREDDLQQGITPDDIINSIADLPDWWETHISDGQSL